MSDVVELSINLKLSLGIKSNLAVAGILPSFLRYIYCVFVFPTLVLGNFNRNVLSSRNYFGFYTRSVGRTPYPLISKVNLCVLGYCSPN